MSASCGGNITCDGGANVTARGVCWSTTTNPTLTNSKTTDGTGTGSFISALTDLTPGTRYHVRAYAINSAGPAYGADVAFETSPPFSLYVSSDGQCGQDPCYSTIQAAISAAKNGDEIKVKKGTYKEFPINAKAVTVTLSGGWNDTFTDRTGTTEMYAPRATGGGTVKVRPNIKVVAPQ